MKMTLLIVDDQQAHRLLIKRALQKSELELHVVEASSLAEAKARWQEETPALVILDLHLGEGRSTTFLDELHAARPELPLLVVSTSGLESDIEECYRRGAAGYLMKSDDVLKFGRELREAVSFLLRQIAE